MPQGAGKDNALERKKAPVKDQRHIWRFLLSAAGNPGFRIIPQRLHAFVDGQRIALHRIGQGRVFLSLKGRRGHKHHAGQEYDQEFPTHAFLRMTSRRSKKQTDDCCYVIRSITHNQAMRSASYQQYNALPDHPHACVIKIIGAKNSSLHRESRCRGG